MLSRVDAAINQSINQSINTFIDQLLTDALILLAKIEADLWGARGVATPESGSRTKLLLDLHIYD